MEKCLNYWSLVEFEMKLLKESTTSELLYRKYCESRRRRVE